MPGSRIQHLLWASNKGLLCLLWWQLTLKATLTAGMLSRARMCVAGNQEGWGGAGGLTLS